MGPRSMSETPSRLQREVARRIVTQYLRVRDGEAAIVESWEHTRPMAAAMVDELRRVGSRVLFVYNDEDSWWRTIDRRQAPLLGASSPPEWEALKAAALYVNFWGPGDTDRIEALPDEPGDQAFAWLGPWYAAARTAGLRGLRMTTGFVTAGRARQWGLNLARWSGQMLRASLTDPELLARRGRRLAQALARGRTVRITHANGTDLELGLGSTAPRVLDGRPRPFRTGDSPSGMLQQVPAGAVQVALDAKTAEGEIQANRRTNIWWNWSSGGTLRFAKGRLASYGFDEEGGTPFARQYATGTAGRDRTGYLTFGVNPDVRDVANLETIEEGSVTLAVGRNGHLGGKNASSFMSWVTLAGADVAIDGNLVIHKGKLR